LEHFALQLLRDENIAPQIRDRFDEALVDDYTKSAVFMDGVRESGQLGDLGRVVLPLFDAPGEAMRLFLEGVGSRYPSAADLAGRLGLDPSTVARLRERYLSPSSP